MSESVIELKNICKNYGKRKVLSDVNFNVYKGDIYGLVGKNGAGKTTIFKIILGLSDHNGGKVLLEGKEDLDAAREKMGFFVGNNYFPYMSAKENLEYYATMKGCRDDKEIAEVLKLIGLDGVKTRAGGYSLGMKQRLGIGIAILGKPEILILDEPTNGLDPQGIADIRHLVQRLNKEYGMTVMISSHILGELQNTAHRFGIVNQGRIVRELSEEDLIAQTDVIRLKVSDVEKARELLKAGDVEILAEEHEQKSLEDYYFQLIGGAKE